MPTTPNRALRYPVSSNAPNVPVDIQNLATDVDNALAAGGAIVCTSTTRPSTPANGVLIWESDTGHTLRYNSALSSWRYVGNRVVVADVSHRNSLSPTYDGLEVYETDTGAEWVASGGTWVQRGLWTYLVRADGTYNYGLPGSDTTMPGFLYNVTIPTGRVLELEFGLPTVEMALGGGNAHFTLWINGVAVDTAFVSAIIPNGGSGFPAAGPIRLSGQFVGTGASTPVSASAFGAAANAMAVGAVGPWLRYRLF